MECITSTLLLVNLWQSWGNNWGCVISFFKLGKLLWIRERASINRLWTEHYKSPQTSSRWIFWASQRLHEQSTTLWWRTCWWKSTVVMTAHGCCITCCRCVVHQEPRSYSVCHLVLLKCLQAGILGGSLQHEAHHQGQYRQRVVLYVFVLCALQCSVRRWWDFLSPVFHLP